MRIGSLLAAWGKQRRATSAAAPAGATAHAVKAVYLSAIDVFRDLPRAEVERLAETTTMFTCLRGRTIYRPGEASAALFLLKKGRVQIVRESAGGKRLVIATLGPETFFGEMALVGQRFPQDAAAEALEDAVVCVLSRADLERLILAHPRVGLRFLEQLSARLLETELIVEDFAFRSVPARLAGVLPRQAETEADAGVGGAVDVRATHQELADMTATYRETVPLTLNDFREQGLVDLGRRSVRVLDRDGLQAVAEQ